MRPKNPQQTKYSPARGEILKLFPQTLFRGFMPIDLDVVADDVRSFVQKVKTRVNRISILITLPILMQISETNNMDYHGGTPLQI